MSQDSRPRKRFSVITDMLIFAIILILIFVIFNLFNFDLTNSNREYEELSLIDNESIDYRAVEKENTLYINNLKAKYNINVSYGNITKGYMEAIHANIQTNEIIANNNIKLLAEALEKYPIDLFKNINDKNYTISIILVDEFNNDNLALASRNNLNEYRMYISNTENFERAFHHEMYHILEYYMTSLNKDVNKDWEKLNPDSFSYIKNTKNLNKDYVYYTKEDIKSSYFVTKYSKVSEKEDRAEVFAEIMTMNRPSMYLTKDTNIYNKARFILNNIHKIITTSDLYADSMVFN